ncbi:type III-B CRISPR module RAMP protein Cmr4 [Accumulibacter sp.]|uniref:CRISPR-associated RAMP protein, Cmr4 family n=1 Tax=Accumulibacter regalis TaxID=522306 RepID=C7RP11_ACCRE|nr:type III-B CRISPR module RAMP protein Cmr4 [Accumulibacter sp.]MBN8496523.1 type III-B CRISPR module RAMP protein Cmr4 [Accumulibacter sp.]MBO3715431.1 type III-B CRISPR module RAMP protein Cmr4 [Accumulibacter sp.]
MFEAQQLVFYSCVSPVHMGAGQAIGVIDNPIQREVHTGHPLIAGSGLKGAVRHHFTRTWQDNELISRLFGPERNASDHAGAIAFSDATLVTFPVRSLRNTFVHATCPSALARLKRLAGSTAAWAVPSVDEGKARLASAAILSDKRLLLEVFDFAAAADAEVTVVADWLATNALPPGAEHEFFRNKLKNDLVVLSDTDFGHFVRNATVIEAHVRIDDKTGAAADGALFYTENLPPESLLVGLLLASVERRKGPGKDDLYDADRVLAAVLHDQGERCGLHDHLLQVGGDATTGRGLLVIHAASGDRQ